MKSFSCEAFTLHGNEHSLTGEDGGILPLSWDPPMEKQEKKEKIKHTLPFSSPSTAKTYVLFS